MKKARGFTSILLLLLAMTAILFTGCEDDDGGSDVVQLERIESYPLSIAEPSGLTWDGEKLWTVSDEDGLVYRIDFDGTILHSFDTSAIDLEGISYDLEANRIWLLDEEGFVMQYGLNGEGFYYGKNLVPGQNDEHSFEGLCYHDSLIVVTSKIEPYELLKIEFDSFDFLDPIPLSFPTSGICYSGIEKTYYMISDENQTLCLWHEEQGTMEKWGIQTQDPEGVVVINDRVYVVDDSENRLDVYILP